MKFNLEQLIGSLNEIARRYKSDIRHTVIVDLELGTEDFENGVVGSVLSLTAQYSVPHDSYSTIQAPEHGEITVEIYPVEENRTPRKIETKTQELIFKR